MTETIIVQGDTGKVVITGIDLVKRIDLSNLQPNQIYSYPYLVTLKKPWEQEVDFND
jgi:hypothetical protein